MILRHTNLKKNTSVSGVTLIECLVVLTILAGLIAAVGTSFTMSLKSYVGEHAAEAIELESQRAALELEHFASRAINIRIMADPANSSTTGYESGVLGGTRVELTQPNYEIIAFQFRPVQVLSDGTQVGELGINRQNTPYVYTTNARFKPTADWYYPFQVSQEGGVSFRWTVPTPASGDIKVGGSVLPGI